MSPFYWILELVIFRERSLPTGASVRRSGRRLLTIGSAALEKRSPLYHCGTKRKRPLFRTISDPCTFLFLVLKTRGRLRKADMGWAAQPLSKREAGEQRWLANGDPGKQGYSRTVARHDGFLFVLRSEEASQHTMVSRVVLGQGVWGRERRGEGQFLEDKEGLGSDQITT